MKHTLKKSLAIILAAATIICCAPLSGIADLDLPEFGSFQKLADSVSDFFDNITPKAEAALEYKSGYYTYTVDKEGNATIIDVDPSISGNVTIPSRLGGYPVKIIDDNAFYKGSNVTGIVLPDGLTEIRFAAFNKCESLIEITIPESVTVIENKAFQNCTSLTNIIIPGSVEYLHGSLFWGCSNLTTVTICNGVKSIAGFGECKSLKNISIPDSVTNIGGSAFYGCSALETITIPKNVTSIGERAFVNCTRLTSISIPDNVTSIGEYIFAECPSLTSVKIGNGITTISKYSFYKCVNLTCLTIGNKVKNIGNSAFDYCSNLKDVYYTGDLSGWCSINFNTVNQTPMFYADNLYINGKLISDIVIPSEVTDIDEYAFFGCSTLKSVTISNSVTSIGYRAFENCINLANITIPDSIVNIFDHAFYNTEFYNDKTNWYNDVLYIGKHLIKADVYISGKYTVRDGTKTIADSAFDSCMNLSDITIPDSVIWIGSNAFYYTGIYNDPTNWNDEVLYIGNHLVKAKKTVSNEYSVKIGTQSIACGAFMGCAELSSITIPDSVLSIGKAAFSTCKKLTDIKMSRVNVIGEYAFRNCTSLKNITLPDSIINIGDGVFYECTDLESIIIFDGIISIGDYMFYKCSDLVNITLPDGVTSIGDYAFYDCSNLVNITISDGLASIGDYVFYNCSSLTDIIIPDSVSTIGCYAFYGCSAITNIIIPNNVTALNDGVFAYCGELVDIIIPEKVIFVGKNAFSDCRKLTSIIIHNDIKMIDNYAFDGPITDVYFEGSEEQWNKIIFGLGVEELLSYAIIHFNVKSEDYIRVFFDSHSYTIAENSVYRIKFKINCHDIDAENLLVSCESSDETGMTACFDKYDGKTGAYVSLGINVFGFKSGTYTLKIHFDNDLLKTEEIKINVTTPMDIYIKNHVEAVPLWQNIMNINNDLFYEPSWSIASEFKNSFEKKFYQFVNFDYANDYYKLVVADWLLQNSSYSMMENKFENAYTDLYSTVTSEFIKNILPFCGNSISSSEMHSILTTNNLDSIKNADFYDSLNTAFLEARGKKIDLITRGRYNGISNICQDMFDQFSFGAESVAEFFKAVNCMNSVLAYIELCEEMKIILSEAAVEAEMLGNDKLAEALNDYAEIDVEESAESFIDKIILNYFGNISLNFIKSLLKEHVLQKIKDKALAVAAVRLGIGSVMYETLSQEIARYKFGMSLAVAGFFEMLNLSDRNEYLSRTIAAAEISECIYKIYLKKNSSFSRSATFENAKVLNYSFQMLNSFNEYSMKELKRLYSLKETFYMWSLLPSDIDFSTEISIIQKYININRNNIDYAKKIDCVSKILGSPINANELERIVKHCTKNKIIVISCPVNVFLYDASGNLIASIVNNEIVSCNDDSVGLISFGTEKILSVPFDFECSVKIVGYDSGTMDVKISEFSNKMVKNTVKFSDIGVDKEKSFQIDVSSGFSVNDKDYCLSVDDGTIIYSDSETANSEYTVNWIVDGILTISTYKKGEKIVAPENPVKEGYTFAGWAPEIPDVMPAENLTFTAVWNKIHEHSYTSSSTPATCTQNGIIIHTCECGDSYTETISATGHTAGEWEVVTNSSCSSVGEKVKKCVACGEILETEEIAMTEHVESSWITVLEPTTETEGKKVKKCFSCDVILEESVIEKLPKDPEINISFEIRRPSTSTISYGDSIILHADIEGELPAGYTVQWTASNGNFSYKANGATCSISPAKSGDTTFTATIYDADGNAVSTDEQTMTSKAGFFDKIIAFFKKIFGRTKTYPEIFGI